MNWLRPASLRPRREAERDLFLHGRTPEGPIPVWAADAEGRVDFRQPVRRLSAPEALALLRPPSVAPPAPADSEPDVAPMRAGWLAALLASFTAALSRS